MPAFLSRRIRGMGTQPARARVGCAISTADVSWPRPVLSANVSDEHFVIDCARAPRRLNPG